MSSKNPLTDEQKAKAKIAKAKYRASAKGMAKERETAEKYRLANRAKFAEQSAKFRERNPEKVRAWDQAYRERPENRAKAALATRAWVAANAERAKAAQAEYYARTREERVRKSVEWQRANPDKARARFANYKARKKAAQGQLSSDIVSKLMVIQKGKCACCRAKFGARVKRHLDHIVSLKAGGANQDTNVQLLCASCNCSKGAKDPILFMQSRGMLL